MRPITTRPNALVALATVPVLLLATACSGAAGGDRAGGSTRVLKMATIDGYEFGTTGGFLTGPETFAEALEEVSGGRMRVEVTENYGEGDPHAESRLVEAIADSELDGGWPATRAFSAAGIRSLEAIEAPMRLTTEHAVQQLLTGDGGKAALESLDKTGITGLAMLYGGLRRPFAKRMLLSPADWAGARMRVFGSPVQEATVTALGGKPVQAGTKWIDMLNRGELDGAEFAIDGYANNGYSREAGNVPLNVVLWPKVFVLSLSSEVYDSLDDQQRAWVSEATVRAVDEARYTAPAEDDFLPDLCSRGVRFASAAGWQLDALRDRVEPVLRGLRDEPETAPLMKAVDTIAAEAPLPDVPQRPADCTGSKPAAPPDADASLPDGVWRVEIPEKAVSDAGQENDAGWSGVWTLSIDDARFVLSCAPLEAAAKDCGNSGLGKQANFEAGPLKGTGSTVFFVNDRRSLQEAGACNPDCYVIEPYSASWHVDGDTLTFTADQGSHLTIGSWTRIG